MPKTLKDHIKELDQYQYNVTDEAGKKLAAEFRDLKSEYNWKVAALSDSNAQLKDAHSEIDRVKDETERDVQSLKNKLDEIENNYRKSVQENEAKSLVIVDLGIDLERLNNHLGARITNLQKKTDDSGGYECHMFAMELKVYQEIKKLME